MSEARRRVVVAGGTGFIGRRLSRLLRERGREVVVLTRGQAPSALGAASERWDAREGGAWEAALDGADAIVNLCGAGVADRPWTRARRRELADSRLGPTRALVEAISRARRAPKVFLSASAVGFYGDRGETPLGEDAARGEGFLAELCEAWETQARRAAETGIRVVLLRIGVVLGREGGALARMLPPFRLGLGGRLGGGEQWMPWIHADDAAGLAAAALEEEGFCGPVNAVAPGPATNADFTRTLGRVLGRPTPLPVPAFLLRALLGEMSGLLLGSQKVLPEAALRRGYSFRHPSLGGALANLAG